MEVMSSTPLEGEVNLSTVATARTLACGEVFGGNEPVHTTIELPGLHGVLYSHPCHGARGGDVHYLSVCGSGLLARVCIADVLGHGEVVAQVSAQMHAHLRRSVDVIDERRVFREMDRRLQDIGVRAMTTAALLTYYPPSRRLTVSYAGHPPGWRCSSADGRWTRLSVAGEDRAGVAMNLPLGTGFESAYGRSRQRMTLGDRLVMVTDGVLEAPSATGEEFGEAGVERVLLDTTRHSPERLVRALLDALAAHTGGPGPVHDDVTIFVGEIVPGPKGPAVWHVLKNRLLTRVIPSLRHPQCSVMSASI
jgi:serine phosphatase RsbU (regulator of sigma subunit)